MMARENRMVSLDECRRAAAYVEKNVPKPSVRCEHGYGSPTLTLKWRSRHDHLLQDFIG